MTITGTILTMLAVPMLVGQFIYAVTRGKPTAQRVSKSTKDG